MITLVPHAVLSQEQIAYLSKPSPEPKVCYYSSERVRRWETFKLQHPTVVLICTLVISLIKLLLAVVFFPLGLVMFLSGFCQALVLPAAFMGGCLGRLLRIFGYIGRKDLVHPFHNIARDIRIKKIERTPIQYDHVLVDSIELHLNNAKPTRWILVSDGNFFGMENRFKLLGCRNPLVDLAEKLEANLLFFNYPGVVSSRGPVSKEGLVKSYQACVRYLKDPQQGLGAKEILGYGISLGGAVQAEALKDEVLDGSNGVQWILIKDRTFTSMREVGKSLFGKFGVWLTRGFGWDMEPAKISETVCCPEIFIYSSQIGSQVVASDGKFEPNLSFASAFVKEGTLINTPKPKVPIGMPLLGHAENLYDELIDAIAVAAKSFLKSSTFEN